MYNKNPKETSESQYNFGNYIQGNDVYNSKLLYSLQDTDTPRENYLITRYEYRPDLISFDFYGTKDLEGFVIYQSHLPLSGFTRGTVLKLIPRSVINKLLEL